MATPAFTPKMELFCREYLADLDAKHACIRAGYSPRSAHVTSSRLMQRPQVQARIAELKRQRERRLELTADRVVEEVAALAFANVEHFTVAADGAVTLSATAPEGAMRALAAIRRGKDKGDVEVKLWDKPSALKLLMEHFGLLVKRHEHSGPAGGPIPHAATVTLYMPENGRGRRDGVVAHGNGNGAIPAARRLG
jgi:phage terminase small subunit